MERQIAITLHSMSPKLTYKDAANWQTLYLNYHMTSAIGYLLYLGFQFCIFNYRIHILMNHTLLLKKTYIDSVIILLVLSNCSGYPSNDLLRLLNNPIKI